MVERRAGAGDVDEAARRARRRGAVEAVGEDAVGATAAAAGRDFGRDSPEERPAPVHVELYVVGRADRLDVVELERAARQERAGSAG